MGKYTFFADRPVGNFRKVDPLLIVSILLLWGLGIFTLFVCTLDKAEILMDDRFYFVRHQLMWSAVSLVAMLSMALLPMNFIHKCVAPLVLVSLFLCLCTLIPGIGSENNGAVRWIKIGRKLTFQPSEIAKFAVVMFLANYFSKEQHELDEDKKSFIYPLTGLLAFTIAIFLQKDFSTGLFVFVVGAVMFYVTGAKIFWFGPLILLAIPASVLLVLSEEYRINRVIAFLKPDDFLSTAGFQQHKARIAISSGGFWGSGMGTGLSAVNNIPEVQSDYIFAGWTSAMGFIGVLAYFVVLIFFAWRCYRIAFTTKNMFAAFGTFGCASMIVLQSLANCGVVSGALPTTGIPLPFFSSGGTSLVFTMAMCGFMINSSYCDTGEDYYESKNLYKKEIDTESLDGMVIEYE